MAAYDRAEQWKKRMHLMSTVVDEEGFDRKVAAHGEFNTEVCMRLQGKIC